MGALRSIINLFRFRRRNWRAVALCVSGATVFWFFNALNKNYTTNLNFPIEFDYNPDRYVALRPLPGHVRINVTGMGWDLFRRSLGLKMPPLVIPLERPAEVKKIIPVPALFANQIERFEINFIITDTLNVALDLKTRRWITVAVDSPSILFKNDFTRTSQVRIVPDSVFVEGPMKLIDNLIEPHDIKLSQRNIDEDFSADVEVGFLNNELIKRNPPTVFVSFQVDRLVEVNDSVRLEVINYPKGAKPYFGVKTLHCRFGIPQRLLPQYHPDSVQAVIDLKNFTRGIEKVLPEVKGLPPYSRVEKIDSIFVRF